MIRIEIGTQRAQNRNICAWGVIGRPLLVYNTPPIVTGSLSHTPAVSISVDAEAVEWVSSRVARGHVDACVAV